MHMLLLLPRVAVPEECARTSLDVDWLLALADHHELVVAVDENSTACDALRDADVTVHVSDKRHVYMPGGERVDADTALANWVATQHATKPFDLVVATSERPPFGPVLAAVPEVPWAVLAASGPAALTHRLAVDTPFLAEFGPELWRAASNVAVADLVVSPVDPAHLDLAAMGGPVRTLLPVPEPDLRPYVGGELIVVMATGTSHSQAPATMEAAAAAIDAYPSTTVVVVYTPAFLNTTDVATGIAAGIPAGLEEQVVLVPAERHGSAGAWLDAADALVLADESELLLPSVARRAALVPTVVLPRAGTHGSGRTCDLLTAAPTALEPGAVELLPWSSAARTATDLRALRRSETPQFVVIHDEEATREASRWLGLRAMDRYDVVIGATPQPPWSMPHPRRLDGGLVGLHRRTWTAVADELGRISDLPALVSRLTDLAGARSHTIGAVTVDREPPTIVIPADDQGPLALVGGPLPQVRPPAPRPAQPEVPQDEPKGSTSLPTTAASLRAWVRTARWPTRARLALPWRLGLSRTIRDDRYPDGVIRWAKEHRISDRARLLLPWKWGLLPRAMKDRW